MNSVMVETVNVTAKERVLLERCQGFLSKVEAMQVTKLLSLSSSLFGLRDSIYVVYSILILIWGKRKQTGYRL